MHSQQNIKICLIHCQVFVVVFIQIVVFSVFLHYVVQKRKRQSFECIILLLSNE